MTCRKGIFFYDLAQGHVRGTFSRKGPCLVFCMEDPGIMMISMKEMASNGGVCDLCRSLEAGPVDGKEIVLDFNGVKEVKSSDAEDLMSHLPQAEGAGHGHSPQGDVP